MQQIVYSQINAQVLGTYSWATGFTPARIDMRPRTDEEALRHALWLEHKDSSEEGLEFLDDWLYRHTTRTRNALNA